MPELRRGGRRRALDAVWATWEARDERALPVAVLIGIAAELLLALLFANPHAGQYAGVPGALGALIAVGCSVAAGVLAGGAVALVGALALVGIAHASWFTVPTWTLTAVLAGIGFGRVREQLGDLSILERGLMPRAMSVVPPLEIATRYEPGGRLRVAGDFLDAIQLDDGSVAIVIGDVGGHGPDAAALGVALRAAWRGLIRSGTDASEVLAALSHLVEDERPVDDLFATACCAWLDARHERLRLALAGHPPPVLVGPNGAASLRAPANVPLGFPAGEHATTELHLPAEGGWTLLFYTDGLVETRPGAPTRFGIEGLLASLPGAVDERGWPDLERILEAAKRARGGRFVDDVGILALGRLSRRAAAGTARRPSQAEAGESDV